MKRSILVSLLLVVGLLITPPLVAAEEALSPEALEIADALNCPVCEGLSVRDSNSQLSQDMRRQIQRMLDEGKTRQEVLDYFVDRYGVGVLREPPKEGFVLTLWWGPVIGLAVGVVVLATFLRQRRARGKRAVATGDVDEAAGADLQAYEQRLLREIDRMDAPTS
ncbi:MAG: cytochrome c-type biogenesis protein CcmH [Sphaerobacter sp.]|nr:cytochrome c-type biogenesis protein CcmH [Sphaerobacter sp.]